MGTRLLVVRHAIAEEAAEFAAGGLGDDRRPLSEEGRRRMERGALGLAGLLDGLDLLASSPLLRARQTAEILAAVFGGVPIVETDTLVPGADPRRFLTWLEQRAVAGIAAAVGHEPHLGRLAAQLLGCRAGGPPPVAVKKGSAILFELAADSGAGATLLWSLAPGHLRRLAG